MTTRPQDCAEGEALKADALTLLEARREVYACRGRRVLPDAVLRSGAATADDVRDVIELPLEDTTGDPGPVARCWSPDSL